MEQYIQLTVQEAVDLTEGLPVEIKLGKRIRRTLTTKDPVVIKKEEIMERAKAKCTALDKRCEL